ncbi:tail fiber assembly protein [Dysosmobacter sp.]|uniref:tail fiber assembly protein n=1 Tax=Dysosmobacter sp. TaxID=2591382 RepID=UPI002A965408|nr:tail fiber assembly protein [Dysosmobacter sp.]MDY5613652.1 tail fiber assembly protein [Dysosmobacter sp.]
MKIIKYRREPQKQAASQVPFYPQVEFKCQDNQLESILSIARAEAYNGEVTVEDIPTTSEEARAQRNRLLEESDWTQVLDAPIDASTREAYRAYRQSLRDIPEQEGFPGTIIWPKLPSVTKADPDPVDTAVDTMLGGETA